MREYKYISGRTYSSYDKDAYQYDIIHHGMWDIFWNSRTHDLELLWSYVLHIISEIADIQCPMRRMKICNDNLHWMSKETIEYIRQKDVLDKKARLPDLETGFHIRLPKTL